jgi:TRAP-type mannitol/chloroaromatic compound transport system substrate-binding protein
MGARVPAPLPQEAARRDVLRVGGALASGLVASACSRSEKSGEAHAASGTSPIVWKVQTHIGGDNESFRAFRRFCTTVGELSEGRLVLEPHPPGAIVGVFDMFEALKSGMLDAASTSPTYLAGKYPELAFLSSYPLGLDRPGQWETWFYSLGGVELARKMHEPHNIRYVGPVQHDLNIIHSRVPIRSFEDFRDKKIRMPGGLIADVFTAAGAKTMVTAGDQIYQGLANGSLDAADFVGPAVNFELGFANVAKFIIMGPTGTPCVHQPCDLVCVLVNMGKWSALPKHLQDVVEYAVRRYSWDHYTEIQRADTLAWDKYKEKGVEILRISNADVEKFRRVAIPIWFKWAKMSPIAREAFASQLAYMKSPAVSYVNDSMLVDSDGKKLSLDG